MEPKLPAGTPEYEAYRKQLEAELALFAAGEEPYPLEPLTSDGRIARAMGIGL